jgi:hypothetical protein
MSGSLSHRGIRYDHVPDVDVRLFPDNVDSTVRMAALWEAAGQIAAAFSGDGRASDASAQAGMWTVVERIPGTPLGVDADCRCLVVSARRGAGG